MIIYREMGGAERYLKFLTEICITLLTGNPQGEASDNELPAPPKKRMKATDVPECLRFDKYDHWPMLIIRPNAQRCKMEGCKKKTMFKCQVYLCMNKSTCFLTFHGK
jgi:hypothetical protein